MNRHAEEKIGPPAKPYNSNFWRTSKKSKSELSGDQLNCGEEEIKESNDHPNTDQQEGRSLPLSHIIPISGQTTNSSENCPGLIR